MSDSSKMISRGSLLIVLALVAGKLSGVLKDVLLAYFHGISNVTDAFFLASAVSTLMNAAVLASIPLVTVPLYAKYRAGSAGLEVLLRLSRVILAASLLVTFSVLLFGGQLVELASNASVSVNSMAASYLRIMSFGFCVSAIVVFASSILSVDGRVAPTYIVALANNLFFCVALIIFRSDGEFVWVVAAGVLSWALLAIWTAGPILRIARHSIATDEGARQSPVNQREVIAVFMPALLALYMEHVNGFVGTYFASHLDGHAITVWAYAGKVGMLFSSVFLVFLTGTLFPRMSVIAAGASAEEFSGYLERCIRLLMLLLLPVVVYLADNALGVAELLFGRGRASSGDQQAIGALLAIVLYGVPFALVRDVLNRACFSMDMASAPLKALGFSCAVNVGVCFALVGTVGVAGVGWALVASLAFNSTILGWMLRRRGLGVNWLRLLWFGLLCVVVSLITLSIIEHANRSEWAWLVLWIPYFATYIALLWALRVIDAIQFVHGVQEALGQIGFRLRRAK